MPRGVYRRSPDKWPKDKSWILREVSKGTSGGLKERKRKIHIFSIPSCLTRGFIWFFNVPGIKALPCEDPALVKLHCFHPRFRRELAPLVSRLINELRETDFWEKCLPRTSEERRERHEKWAIERQSVVHPDPDDNIRWVEAIADK